MDSRERIEAEKARWAGQHLEANVSAKNAQFCSEGVQVGNQCGSFGPTFDIA